MHIPDGFLDTRTAGISAALAAAGLGIALRQAKRTLPPRRVPLLGLASAFVFAAQMLNFPVAGGTSGHLIGGVLAGALLGPSAAVIVISAVLIVQCFLFADERITALGANIFNMALIGGVGGWVVYALMGRLAGGLFGRILGAIFGGWCSTVLAAVACAGELSASGTVGWNVALPAMAGVHMLIGLGEGLITALVLLAIAKTRPDLLGVESVEPGGGEVITGPRETIGIVVVFGLLISLGLAVFVSPYASPWPDGLDKVAATLGFKDKESEHRAVPAVAPDYKVKLPGIESEAVSTAVAGAGGTLMVFGMSWILARLLVPHPKRAGADASA